MLLLLLHCSDSLALFSGNKLIRTRLASSFFTAFVVLLFSRHFPATFLIIFLQGADGNGAWTWMGDMCSTLSSSLIFGPFLIVGMSSSRQFPFLWWHLDTAVKSEGWFFTLKTGKEMQCTYMWRRAETHLGESQGGRELSMWAHQAARQLAIPQDADISGPRGVYVGF